MDFIDDVFREYGDPTNLLNAVIASRRFVDFIDNFFKKKKYQERWEYYLHKLPPWDDTSWNEFNRKMDEQEGVTPQYKKASKKELETTVRNSYEILSDFSVERGE